jgi:hypothetical protein
MRSCLCGDYVRLSGERDTHAWYSRRMVSSAFPISVILCRSTRAGTGGLVDAKRARTYRMRQAFKGLIDAARSINPT